jgi:lipid II:glycine glycyltransferase (peptidoglycan interpeptide bridge formation enzyme)
MIIKEIKDNKIWEEFLLSRKNTLFVQSYQYGEFYKTMGEDYWIFGIFDENNKVIGGSLVLSTHAKRGDFLYLPYGPILPEDAHEEALRLFANFLKEFGKEKKYDFIRVSPFMEDTNKNKLIFKKNGFINAPMHILAENTWILDLSLSEEELLSNMNKNHRNLIRRCIRENCKIEKNKDSNKLNTMFFLYDETAKRHKFHKFSKKYITNEFKSFLPNNAINLNAYLPEGSPDASAIIMCYGDMAAYRHGASINIDKKIPTSYLVQWEAIKEAKKRGMNYYNFWGVAPEKASKKHPFFGITHFKKGFGGFQKNLVHCQDLPLSPKYFINWTIETIRRFKRGF